MEKSPDKETLVEATSGADLRSPEQPCVRRRLIQSTLLPHKSQDIAVREDQEFDPGEDQDYDEEEYCGSQTKKNRKRKPKAVAQSRASRKVPASGKETQKKKMEEEDSPVTVKADFFVKVSERRHEKRQPKEQLPLYSPNGSEKTSSPPDFTANTKSPPQMKRRASATPKKNRMNTTPKKIVEGTPNEACCGSTLANPCIQSVNISQPIPDLRLEAKLTAEENSRIFAGKQIHPFFSSWKTGKRNLETTDLENNWCSTERKEKRISFNPVHVFEKVQDDDFSLDWRNWTFCDRSFVSTSWSLESVCLPINEGSVNALDFDNFLNVSPFEASFCQQEGSSNQFPVQLEEESLDYSPLQQEKFPLLSSTLLADEQVTNCDQQRDNDTGHEIVRVDCFSEKAEFVQKLDIKWQGVYLQERMTSSYHDCDGQPENSLWTNKYQPEKAIEICGNSQSVKFLNEWLRLWHEKGTRISTTDDDKWIVQEDNYCPSDSDSEDIDEETALKNVLLVTGSVGSGKSAAIYACAKEQGFQIIEVNASDWRSGALVKQKFREAVESHWLQCAMQNPEDSHKRNLLKPSSATCNTRAAQGSDNEFIELIPVCDGEDSNNASATPRKSFCQEKVIARDQSEIKTLILFEDVDATLYEDRGFIATIQQLAETAKRPMILTSNSNNPILPNNLDRLEISFTIPSSKELLSLVYMVCALEKAQIEPSLVERFIDHCQGDIRKTIMNLQFWCQGQSHRKDSKVRKRYGPLVFDLDAGHLILPQIIPCGYSSHLSEMIEEEISKSLSMVEKNVSLTGIVEEEEQNYNDSRVHNNERDATEAKKDAILSRHCSDRDVEFAVECGTTTELSSSSGSPVAFIRRNVQRRHDTIMSSGSEEECLSNRFPAFPGNVFELRNNEVNVEINSMSPSHCPNGRSFNLITEQLLCGGEKFEKSCGNSVTPDFSHVNDTCNSFDISCVPESSFVPETEIVNGTELFSRTLSSGHVDNGVEIAFESSSVMPNSVALEFNRLDDSIAGDNRVAEMLVRNFDLNEEPVHGEEMGDTHIEHVEALPRENEMMDECSHMDFSRRSESMQKPLSSLATDFVQETWRKLRHCHMDLQQYVSLEQRDASEVLKLAYKMTNLISEADLLLRDCQSMICDYLEPSMVPFDKSHSFSWYDDQLQMASTAAQHGMCLYAKQSAVVGSTAMVDLACLMLASSANTMALGKLISQDKRMIRTSEKGPPCCGISSKSELESPLCSIVQSIVPPRSCLALKGDVFHEYLSSLAQISRSESSRLSESINKSRQRRGRVARNYLSTGALGLSPEDISLLGQYNSYLKVSDQSIDES